ncbi:SMI1/KNR4 family protein [Sporocytophaga myxococcoides]|uniref:SMI1/KNR4 family protein n=1 Tax=Sporocytophaga myxococcoides TaxID=153721 RepID=UPI00041F5F65|nr:SMI1/KNR4 family protein [Sporocytophaga myxococcoides]
MIPTIEHIILRIERDKKTLGITLYNKATLEEIVSFERVMNIKLPDDIKTFYKYCNGFESEEDMFRIIPLDEIIDRREDVDSYLINPKDFHIAEYMIYCDMWTLTVDEINNNKYSIYNNAETAVDLTNNFSEFMDRFLNGGVFDGLYDWRKN